MNSNASFQVSSVDPDDLTFGYDAEGRRVSKNVYRRKNNAWQQTSATLFLYDGWNLAAECNATGGAIRTYLWGTDLSGSWEGAGGVGGLLWLNLPTANPASVCFTEYDGNGNVTGLVRAFDAMEVATYEYGPFGESVRVSGIGGLNPFQFSTKYTDDETGLLYYGYRYYSPSQGRWVSRDPCGEEGGFNIHAFDGNDEINRWDFLGLTISAAYDISAQTFTASDVEKGGSFKCQKNRCSCGSNDPKDINRDGGPLPPGTYNIYTRSNDFNGLGNAWILDAKDSNPGNDIIDSGPGKGRFSFRIHLWVLKDANGNDVPQKGSQGCIVLSKDCYDEFNKMVQNTKVDYTKKITIKTPHSVDGHTIQRNWLGRIVWDPSFEEYYVGTITVKLKEKPVLWGLYAF